MSGGVGDGGGRTMTYQEYLKTDHWQRMRANVFAHYGRHCALCGTGSNINIHHVTYVKDGRSIWFREEKNDLIVLCKPCHELMHRAERMDPEKHKMMTERMKGGRSVVSLPESGTYQPPERVVIPKLPSTKHANLWTPHQKAHYKKIKAERHRLILAQRGGK